MGYKRKRGNKKKVRQEDVYDDGICRLHTLAADERAALANESDLWRIYCDPGKRDRITMVDDDDRFCWYRNGRRVHESKRLFYRRKGDRRRAEMGVDSSDEAAALSNTIHNTNDRAEFLQYVAAKIAYLRRFGVGYRQGCFRRYRWHQYVERQRADVMLVKHVRAFVGDAGKAAIFYGDWSSSHQLKHFISTPCLRVRRLVAKAFPRVYLLDEFRTSKLYWRDPSVRLQPFGTMTQRRPEPFRIHSLLTLNGDDIKVRMDATGMPFESTVKINRDKNAARNMRSVLQHQLATGERPAPFRRR